MFMIKKKTTKTNSPFSSTFGAKLQELRRKKRLTQAELAERLGVPIRKVSYYERFSKNPTTLFVEEVALALGVPAKDLLNPTSKIKVEEIPAVIKPLKQKIQKIAELPRKEQESIVVILDGLFSKYKITV